MSLYGNVKKVGSSNFQFDRIYTTRTAMDKACAEGDGVYIGRYVLVEYGERFNGTQPGEGEQVQYNGQPGNYSIIRTETNEVVPVTENQAFTTNVETDLSNYGAVYDSTVWQKIYTNNGDKYIMVAELNATVPQIKFVKDSPITYIQAEEGQEDLIVGTIQNGRLVETAQLTNAQERFNQPHFDTAIDTELSYTLHLPTMLNLKVDNEDINFNKNGFNPAYSFGEQEGVSTIAWIPEEINNTKYRTTGETDPETNNPLATLKEDNIDVNTKMLFMNFPALGNIMNTLYDLLYGIPSNIDSEKGSLRPYFQQFAEQYQQITVPVTDENDNYITINGEKIYITGKPGTPVSVPVPSGTSNEQISPSGYTVQDGYLYKDGQQVQFTIPDANGLNDDRNWLSMVPGLAEILANNTTGLASVLKSLFGYSDPLTGITKYYLYTDWTTAVDETASNPAVLNKPETVAGYSTTFTPANEGWPNLNEDAGENPPQIINYYTQTDIGTELSAGDYVVDYTTWQIKNIV